METKGGGQVGDHIEVKEMPCASRKRKRSLWDTDEDDALSEASEDSDDGLFHPVAQVVENSSQPANTTSELLLEVLDEVMGLRDGGNSSDDSDDTDNHVRLDFPRDSVSPSMSVIEISGSDNESCSQKSAASTFQENGEGHIVTPRSSKETFPSTMDVTDKMGSNDESCSQKSVVSKAPEVEKGISETPNVAEFEKYFAWCGDEDLFLSQKGASSTDTYAQPTANQDASDNLFGLGEVVRKALFISYHVESLHEWQNEMLCNHIRDDKKNALIIAPTSGGKTLVALILMLRAMHLDRKDCILVLPYVAIVSEKVQELRRLAKELTWLSVAEYAGSKGKIPVPKQKANMRSLYVCTPEKATVLWKSLCAEEKRREEIGMVTIDECHMLRDNPRGAVLEELVVSILLWSTALTRILGLSATIGNPDVIARFLGGGDQNRCTVFNASSRPNQLKEHVIISGSAIPLLRNESGVGVVHFENKSQDLLDEVKDDALVQCPSLMGYDDRVCAKLVFESVKRGDCVLVFCGTRKGCVSLCVALTNAFKSPHIQEHYCGAEENTEADCGEQRQQTSLRDEIVKQRELLIGHLQCESNGLVNKVLLAGISVGIAYHSAELHATERKAVEDAYRRNIISVLCCTSTLAAGVNLPASRVIIRSPRVGPSFLSCAHYLQMVGRAGRTKCFPEKPIDSHADSFIFVNVNDVDRFQSLVENPVEDVVSQLNLVGSYYQRRVRRITNAEACTGITRIILGALSMSVIPMKLSELVKVFQVTLLYQSARVSEIDGALSGSCTLRPFIGELVVLLVLGHLKIVVKTPEPVASLQLKVVCDLDQSCGVGRISLPDDPTEFESGYKEPSDLERQEFLRLLQEDMDCVLIPDYSLRLTALAAASSAASMSVDDAQCFVTEGEELEKEFPVQNPLAVLYLSITEGMSMQLIEDPQHKADENDKRTRSVSKLILRDFKSNPDSAIFCKLGIQEDMLTEWVYGNPTVRKNTKFTEKLTRLWSALFLLNVLRKPHNFEGLCQSFSFDRSTASELSTVLASRCQNLRILCSKLEKLWWYPPLSSHLAKSLVDTCEKQFRPFLMLRHVTIERAKAMYKCGLRSIQDVAAMYPPTLLSESVPHMSRWMAVEVVLDARVILAHEANVLAAESAERKRVLGVRQ